MKHYLNFGAFVNLKHSTVTLITIPPDKVSRSQKYVEVLIKTYDGTILSCYTIRDDSRRYKILFSDDEKRNSFINDFTEVISDVKSDTTKVS